MADLQKITKQHDITINSRERLRASGVIRVDFFSDELITAQTEMGQLNLKGEGLHIETLNSDTGDLCVQGKVTALSYTDSSPALSFFGRLFK